VNITYMSAYPDSISVEDCQTPEEMANAVYQYLQDYAESIGGSRSEVQKTTPENYKRDCWAVEWRAGPSEWAFSVTGGESIAGAEFPQHRGTTEIQGLQDNPSVTVECGNKFTLEFYPY
jgi:hypothetical protein